jgi:1-acyl-sn-glycerol-3-phosphate acyltransferase
MHIQPSPLNKEEDAAAVAAYYAAELLRLLADTLERLTDPQHRSAARLRRASSRLPDPRSPAFWLEASSVLREQGTQLLALAKRRQRGDYQTDPYGLDMEMVELMRPFLLFLYRVWWRVQPIGLENIPSSGRALLVANHSGVLPWDGAMIGTAVYEDHPTRRGAVVRNLFLDWFSAQPFLAPLFISMGQVPGIPENATRLLEEEALVCTFPEGERGIGKHFRQRYRLARFGRGGYVRIALRTGAPLVPVAVVGAEEIYPLLGNNTMLARLLGMPYFPITLTFPWLGPLGLIPFPARWSITFCPPIPTTDYGPDAADDPLVVAELNDKVRDTIQQTLHTRLSERTSLF